MTQQIDVVTVGGNDALIPQGTSAAIVGLSNWGAITATTGAVVLPPNLQTGPGNVQPQTVVAGMVLIPRASGLFVASVRASFSDGTTGGSLQHNFITKAGVGAGVLAGGAAAGKFGARALSPVGALVSAAMVLNVDAAGAFGLSFEGANPQTASISQHIDVAATLTGLLTANGIGTMNFECGQLLCDAVGPTSLVKTPFALGVPIFFGLTVKDTAAHVVTYDSFEMFVQELPA
jgi:hypothetical protein